MNTIRALIVEDDPMVAHINKSFTEAVTGFAVVGIAYTGQAALKYLRSSKVDLAILDLNLPRISGLEVLSTIRKEERETDVIVVSAVNDCKTIIQVLRQGIIAYIEKPFEFSRYRAVLEAYRNFFNKKKKQPYLKQEDIDGVFTYRQWSGSDGAPKNFTSQTLGIVLDYLAIQTNHLSAEEVASGIGLSRATARRYLEHLTQRGLIYRMLEYPVAGRPVHLFGIKNQGSRIQL